MRPSKRQLDEMRNIKFTRNFTCHAEGSVLVEFGDTKVICNASVNESVPRFLKGKNQGWITAEYGMLPRATNSRTDREAARGKQSGRTMEIQRLIGRSLRACVNLKKLSEITIHLDCDVIQADGGTRTAAISGACVALHDAINKIYLQEKIRQKPEFTFVAAVSAGIYRANPVLDLDYAEDVIAETDMNVVMNEEGNFIEVQGTAEDKSFNLQECNKMLELAAIGIKEIISLQKKVLAD